MNWNDDLALGENLTWEGRPAPRAFTFRNWVHSLFGVLLLAVAIYWQVIACGLAKAQPWPWPALIPVPFWLAGLYLAVGHLLLARLEWSRVGYAVTTQRLLIRRGLFRPHLESIPLASLCSFRVKPLGPELAHVRAVSAEGGAVLSFLAVEHPAALLTLLEEALVRNGHEVNRTTL
ncbi:hypothetical protein [Trichloromonas sp.]|uniref:hypothetical protein n=1 Tax=Trichloromonas sp. TaxID=3069249 RepID=UPI002A4912A9|nr:PH domain-containing protein [Trichloromonas sp.]